MSIFHFLVKLHIFSVLSASILLVVFPILSTYGHVLFGGF